MKKMIILGILLIFFQCNIANGEEKTGNFDWPTQSISQYYNALKFLEKNKDLKTAKYHLGEDWNKRNELGSDYGDPVYAIANGIAISIDNRTGLDTIGKIIIIRHTLPNFKPNNTYTIYSFVNGAKLNILIPGNNFKDGRAKQDMLHATTHDSRFTDAVTEEYFEDINWSANHELRKMRFNYTTVNGSSYTNFYHATSKSNPLIRYTCFYDPDTQQFSNWREVNPNILE